MKECKIFRYKSVFFIGPEGSGKTTQAECLYRWLIKQRKKVVLVKIADNHLLAYIFKVILMFFRKSDYYSCYKQLGYFDPNLIKRVFKLWSWLNNISAILVYLFKVKLLNILGYTVISEGHPIHAVINMYNIASFHKIRIANGILTNVLFRLLQAKHALILLDSPYDVLLERQRRRKSPIEPRWYINVQKIFLDVISRNFNSYLIDTSKDDVVSTFQKIKDYLMR